MEADQMNSKKWFSKEHQAEMLERLLRLGLDRNEAKLRIEGVNAEAKGMFDKQEARNVVMQDMFSKIGKGTR